MKTLITKTSKKASFSSHRVPNLQLDGLAVELDGADLEVDADGRDVGLGVGVVGEPKEQTRLSNAGVANQEQLEQIIAETFKHSYKTCLKK